MSKVKLGTDNEVNYALSIVNSLNSSKVQSGTLRSLISGGITPINYKFD